MAKGIREKIRLVSSAGTGHFYTTVHFLYLASVLP